MESWWSQFGAWWLDILETASQEDSSWTLLEGTLPSTPDHWHWHETSRYWALGTHVTANEGSTWDMWSHADTGDLQCGGHQGRLLPPKTLIKTSYLKHETLSSSLFFSFILSLAWKDKASIGTYQATDKGVTFPTAGFVIKDFNLSIMLETS